MAVPSEQIGLRQSAVAKIALAESQAWNNLRAKVASLLYEHDFSTIESLLFPVFAEFLEKCLAAHAKEYAHACSNLSEYRSALGQACYFLSHRLMPIGEYAHLNRRWIDDGNDITGDWFCAIEDARASLSARCDEAGQLLRTPDEYEIGGDWGVAELEHLQSRMEDYLCSLVTALEAEFWKRQVETSTTIGNPSPPERETEDRPSNGNEQGPQKTLSKADRALHELISTDHFRSLTNAEIGKRYRKHPLVKKKGTGESLRSALNRIRRFYGYPKSQDI